MSTQQADPSTKDSIFQVDLLPSESIVWSGQPRLVLGGRGRVGSLIGVILTCIGGRGVSGMVAGMVAAASGRGLPWYLDLVSALPAIVFLSIGLLLLVHHLVLPSIRNKTNHYAITNKRVLKLCTYGGRGFQAVSIGDPDAVPYLNLDYKERDTGDIRMGDAFDLACVGNAEHVFGILMKLLSEDMRSEVQAQLSQDEWKRGIQERKDRRRGARGRATRNAPDDLLLPPPPASFGKRHAGYAKTPRPVLLSTVLTVLFGNLTAQFKWILLIFVTVFFWTSRPWTAWSVPVYWFGPTTVPGEVLRVEEARAKGGRVYVSYTYRYRRYDGSVRTDTYLTRDGFYRRGDRVSVELPVIPVGISRIKGLGPWCPVFESLICTLVVLFLFRAIVGGLREDTRSARLLRIGKPSRGVISDLQFRYCLMDRDSGCVHDMTLVHEVDGKRYQGTTKTFPGRHISVENPMFLLYDPSHPENIVVPDAVINRGVETDKSGAVAVPGMSLGRSLLFAVLPLIVTTINVLCAYYAFIK